MRSGRWVIVAALAAASLGAGSSPAAGQSETTLSVLEPTQGSRSRPDVLIVVRLSAPSEAGASSVRFVVRIDGIRASLRDADSGRSVEVGSVAPGKDARLVVDGVPADTHTLEVVAIPPGSAGAPAPVTFEVTSGPPTAILIVIALVGIAVFLFYRRRILEPWADRYERPGPEPEDEE